MDETLISQLPQALLLALTDKLELEQGEAPGNESVFATLQQLVDLMPKPWTQLTQAQYDALSPPDPEVLYVVVG